MSGGANPGPARRYQAGTGRLRHLSPSKKRWEVTCIGSPMDSFSPAPSPVGPPATRWQATVRRQALRWGPALLAAALGVLVSALGWQGVDHAAQAYRISEIRQHGLILWDSGWYGGNYPLSYSVLFPILGALFTLPAVAVASAAVAAWAFDRLITGAFSGRPLGSWYFAVSTLLPVSIGQLPFLSGEAAGLVAVLALVRGRRLPAVLLGLVAALCSPLAAAFLALVCVVWVCVGRARTTATLRRPLIGIVGASAAVILALAVVFPGTGSFPFPWLGLLVPLLLCVVFVIPLVRVTPLVRWTAGCYGLACLASFLIPNPLGGNAPRLGAAIGVPLLACFLSRPRTAPLVRRFPVKSPWVAAAAVLIPFMAWQWAPGLQIDTSGASTLSAQQRFYQTLVYQLGSRQQGPMRVEVVPTKDHWEAAWVAPEISLARGWERQLDLADNPLFYRPGALTPSSYQQWLVANGIEWVALPSADLDYAAVAEGALLRSGAVPDLTLVWTSPQWQLWHVTDSPGLLSGPGHLITLEPDHLSLQADSAARLLVRVRYTSYWDVSSGQACVGPAAGGWTEVEARQPGTVLLSTSLLAHPPPSCP